MRLGPTPVLTIAILGAGALAASAQPAGMPMRRAGLWETAIASPGAPGGGGMKMRMCVDPARERGGAVFSGPTGGPQAGAGSCSQHDAHPVAGGWAFHTVCATSRGTSETTGTLIGDFQTHYHMTMEMRSGGQTRQAVVDARWLGPCTPGTPDQIVLPNGQTMSIPGR